MEQWSTAESSYPMSHSYWSLKINSKLFHILKLNTRFNEMIFFVSVYNGHWLDLSSAS